MTRALLLASSLLVASIAACSPSTPDPAVSPGTATNEPATVAAVTATEAPATSGAPAATPGPATSAAPAGACDIASYATWDKCVGQKVTIKGKDPGPNVLQHPSVAGPGGGVEQYMDVKGGTQMILVVKKRVACHGDMQATGTLRGISLGGAPGTKESYTGWALDGADVKCL